MTTQMDGSDIRKLVEDKQAFAKYVNGKFEALDKTHKGKLSAEELQPLAVAIGSALGLPKKGSSPDSDHIYDELLGEFLHGKKQGVTKEELAPILADILLGVADGLQRDPIILFTLDGDQLESYAGSAKFEVDAVGVFSELDSTSTNGKLKGSTIQQALTKLSVQQGMPPAADPKVKKSIVEPALQTAGLDLNKELTQTEFLDVYRKVVLAIASQIKQKPITVAHTEKCYDGRSISAFLQNKVVLQQALDEAWESVPKGKNGTVPTSHIRLGLDFLAPYAGLPPLGAVDEMDGVIDDALKLVDVNKVEAVGKEEHNKFMLEMLGSIMLQLQGKNICVSSSVLAKDVSDSQDCLAL